MEIVLGLLVYVIVRAAFLWVGMKLTKVDGKFAGMVVIALVSTLVLLIPIPFVSWILSVIIMYALICKFTDAEFFPDAVLMIVVANGAQFLTSFFIMLPA